MHHDFQIVADAPQRTQRMKKVTISKEESILIARAYVLHPSKWSDVVQDIKQNLDQLPKKARELYQTATDRQLRDRVSTKLGKLTSIPLASVEDADLRYIHVYRIYTRI
ncbi:MAG: hypothetical protein ABW185_01430 [Sedimenticola sp.]